MSKLLDRHGKYKYDDAAPDEDEPRYLDSAERKTRKEQNNNFEQLRTCSNLQPVQPFKDSALFTLLGTLLATIFRLMCGNYDHRGN